MALVRRLQIVTLLVGSLLVFELIAAFFSHSVALLSDVAHVGTDFLSALLTLYAEKVSLRPSTVSMSYGFSRGTVIAAFVNGFSLILLSVIIMGQTVLRFVYPQPVQPDWMIGAATVALVVDGIIVFMLTKGEQNLNIKSSFIHFTGDALVSFGVILAAVLVSITHNELFDPLITFLMIAVMMYTSWKIVKASLLILMEGTPLTIDVDTIRTVIGQLQKVLEVHDIHVWAVSDQDFAASLHVVVDQDMMLAETDCLLKDIEGILKDRFQIAHSVIQVEARSDPEHHGFPHVSLSSPAVH